MRIAIVICSLVLVVTQTFFAAQDPQGPQISRERVPTETRQQAEELWEQALAAKGGREKLHAVHNILVSSFRGRGEKYESVELYVFPNKSWEWHSEPQPFGTSVGMYNLEERAQYQGDDSAPYSSIRDYESALAGGQVGVDETELMFLLETNWLKPVPIASSNDWVGRKRVDVVQTLVGEKRVDFYLDRKSHLPLKMALINNDDGKPYFSFEFYEYSETQGIQLPRYMGFRGKGHLPRVFQLNVEYNEQIFKLPPTVAAGPDAWKIK
jgi:hypothetical protein